MYFEVDALYEIRNQGISSGLHNKRSLMLVGIPVEYAAGLDQASNPSDQLLLDLDAMNNTGPIVGGVVPLERWLRNAAYQTSVHPDRQKFFRERADRVERQKLEQEAPASGETRQERILFVSELLPFGFLAGAMRTGGSVAKLTVPCFEGGEPRKHPYSDEQMQYFGTGWLIGPKHIITNHHVVNGRSEGEAPADRPDFELQGRSLEVQFDYDQDNVAGERVKTAGASASSLPLDYAILELERKMERPPLPLWGSALEFTDGLRLPVNIIQHPAGAPKQMAIRNNLAAALHRGDLAYYTDTDGGSSGSPVCNDRWQVLALHKSATMSLGKFNYQGKETVWINIGTLMHRIIDDLKRNHAGLWTQIGATIV